jgi:hypothetical protein
MKLILQITSAILLAFTALAIIASFPTEVLMTNYCRTNAAIVKEYGNAGNIHIARDHCEINHLWGHLDW